MPERVYNWKRFWCPREAGLNLGDDGFLYDPDSQYGGVFNPSLVASQDLTSKACLALLGEPGIGKSHEIRAFDQVVRQVAEETDDVVFFDLRAYQTDVRLYSAIFENGKFRKWVNGTHRLHLFLDSLDECLLRVQTVTSLLEEELSKYPKERLFLRIACRTAEWPNSFEEALKRLYGKENAEVYELVPLREKDVVSAVAAEGLEPDEFLNEVRRCDAAPLANKPITLRMLINLYIQEKSFPSTRAELYAKGCLLMCQEPDLRRREIGPSSRFAAADLCAAASRIAASTVFGNRYAVWTDIDQGNIPVEDVAISQLCGGTEYVDRRTVEIGDDLVRAAIETGLFTSRGARRMGWAHQTYAEFLAARYLCMTGMIEKQIMSLLTHPADPEQKLVPQLYETAAWAASMKIDVFDRIIDFDPEVLLRSDVASFDPEYKRRLIEKLLIVFEEERLLDRETYKYYSRLNHPSLAEQVRPYIRDKTKGFLVRRVAINIAEACESRQVLPDLVSVALDQEDDLSARVEAASAVARIGDDQARAKLKPLAFGESGTDPEDRLKGWALRAVWPGPITTEELFQALTVPKNEHHIGSYEMFLSDLPALFEKSLSPADLEHALEWAARNVSKGYHLEEIEEWIMKAGWQHLLDMPALAEPYARAAVARLGQHRPIATGTNDTPFSRTISQDHQRRWVVLSTALSLKEVAERPARIVYSQTPLVTNDDFSWLAEQLELHSGEKQQLIAKLMIWMYDYTKTEQFDFILDLRKRFPELADQFRQFDPIEIDSLEGRKLKAQYLKTQRLQKRLEKEETRPLLEPSPKERVLALLDRFEAGEPNAWWWLNREMTLEPNSQYYGDEYQPDLTEMPVWKEADEQIRSRIINAARQYLLHPPNMDKSWVGTNTLNRPYLAGYRALVLLTDKDYPFISDLPDSAWRVWAPVIVAYPLMGAKRDEPHILLLSLAYQKACDDVLQALLTVIDGECARDTHTYIAERVESFWNDRIAAALLEKARAQGIKPSCMGDLLDLLVSHGYEPAIEYAKSQITSALPTEEPERERVLIVAAVLLEKCPEVIWGIIWPVIQNNAGFGRLIFERFVSSYRHERMAECTQQLNEEQVADMYLWLAEQYPHDEDPPYQGQIGMRHNLAQTRDGLLAELKVRGTPNACEQIRRLINKLPQVTWMKWVLIEAERNMRMKTWSPPTAEEIIKLGQDSQRRYVENGRQLLDVLCDSLRRLQQKLHGVYSPVYGLWDNRGNGRNPAYFPKEEERLSDDVAGYLIEDLGASKGVIVNREVQIRRGEETDVHITAVRSAKDDQAFGIVRAIIEVKGCWHKDLETAMETQLVNRYLREYQSPNGLYLVGWFMCDKWADEDYRKKRTPKCCIEEAQQHFAEQAEEICARGDIPNLVLRNFVLDAGLR